MENYENIKSYEDACVVTGETPVNEEELLSLGFTNDEIAYRKLKTITKAINGGEEVSIDGEAWRWMPYFWINSPSGFAFDGSGYGDVYAGAGSGSRLAFLDEKRSNYAGEQFVDLYREYIM